VPEDGTPKFRAKIMGLSAVAEQNALSSVSSSPPPPLASPQSSMNPGNALPTATTAVLQLERDERGNLLDQKDLVAQLQDELARRQVLLRLHGQRSVSIVATNPMSECTDDRRAT